MDGVALFSCGFLRMGPFPRYGEEKLPKQMELDGPESDTVTTYTSIWPSRLQFSEPIRLFGLHQISTKRQRFKNKEVDKKRLFHTSQDSYRV